MEPPTKRLRLTETPHDNFDGEDEGDELNYQPQEVSARRDPDYQLARKRAVAGNRFESAMAGIFSKYSRDFTDVGDEIDLETGEVVVDNGHLANMRYEGDVGVDDGEDEEEEEGIRLEDLVDDDDDEGVRLGDLPDNWDGEDDGTNDEEEEDRIMHGKEAAPSSNALVPLSNQAPTAWPFVPYPPMANEITGFGPANQLSGPLPFNMPQWRFLNDHNQMSWAAPSKPWSPQRTPRNRPSPRYSKRMSPAYDGRASIWAAGPDFEDDWSASPSQRTGTMGSLRKSLTNTRALSFGEEHHTMTDHEDDEQAILEGVGQEVGNSNDTLLSHTTDDEDDVLGAYEASMGLPSGSVKRNGISPGTKKRVAMMRQLAGAIVKPTSGGKKAVGRPKLGAAVSTPSTKAPQTPSSRAVDTEVVAAKMLQTVDPGPEDDTLGDRRRSGRVRKQVDYLGKISWAEALEQGQSNQLVVQLRPTPLQLEGYEHVDKANVDRGLPTPPQSRHDSSDEQPEEAPQSSKGETIPDSQDSAVSKKSSLPRQGHVQHKPVSFAQGDSLYALSDDESPVLLVKPKPSVASKRTTISGHGPKPGGKAQAANEGVVKRRGRPPKVTPPLEPMLHDREVPDSEDDTMEIDTAPNSSNGAPVSAPRRRGRPSKVNSSAKHNSGAETRPRHALAPDEGIDSEYTPDEEDGGAAEIHTMPSSREIDDSQDGTADIMDTPSSRKSSKVLDPETDQTTKRQSEGERRVQSSSSSPRKDAEQQKYSRLHADSETNQTTSTPSHRKPTVSPSKRTPSKLSPSKSSPSKPQTPRHTAIQTSKAPSSRRSILSLLSDDEEDEKDHDELLNSGSKAVTLRKLFSSNRKTWRASALTTEVYHTPVKKRRRDPVSPSSVVKTPGGTTRTCGMDGYRCGRDFCFTCL